MKRLREEAEGSFAQLTLLVESAAPHQSSPFAKRHVHSRLARALQGGGTPRRFAVRPGLLAVGGLLIAATAAAAGYRFLGPADVAPSVAPAAQVEPPAVASRVALPVLSTPQEATTPPVPSAVPGAPSAKPQPRLAAGEDPSRVAEAVRALRKQGDAARAQQLLDQYLKTNPHGALAEDALALAIEAAAGQKDPRAVDYARRYLARYPNGRFRAVAQRAIAR